MSALECLFYMHTCCILLLQCCILKVKVTSLASGNKSHLEPGTEGGGVRGFIYACALWRGTQFSLSFAIRVVF
jgi:hypothetical protein